MGIGIEETGHIWRQSDIVSHFDDLTESGGWYECPKDSQGKRLGPLVGYTKRDELGRQFVGEEYVNFANIEEDVDVVHNLALLLKKEIPDDLLKSCDIFCGIPEGGKTLAAMLALVCNKKFKYPEKKTTLPKKLEEREVSEFFFGRHKIEPEIKIIFVEDVTSSFSSVEKVLRQIRKNVDHFTTTAIVTFFNRSTEWDNFYYSKSEEICIPIINFIKRPIYQYRQDDPFVSDDVKKGNIVWDPKSSWERLLRYKPRCKYPLRGHLI